MWEIRKEESDKKILKKNECRHEEEVVREEEG
jgi:hypothetical protein